MGLTFLTAHAQAPATVPASCSPHRRSDWLRFAQRLDELAAFAADLRPAAAEDVMAAVSGALGGTASDPTAHVEPV